MRAHLRRSWLVWALPLLAGQAACEGEAETPQPPAGTAPASGPSAASAPPAAPAADAVVPDPLYQSWAAYKPGTSVLLEYHEQPDRRRVLTLRKTLVSVTPTEYVIETQMTYFREGQSTAGPVTRLSFPATNPPSKLPKDPPGATISEESLTIGGQTFKARVVTSTTAHDGKTTTDVVYESPDFPGRQCRLRSTTPGGAVEVSGMDAIEVKLVR